MAPPPGKHWQFPPRVLDEMDNRGEIYWSPTGNPRRKIYLDDSEGVLVQDIWLDYRDAHNQNIAITGYPTEKNPDLLARIIQASSNPGDLVLDCFSGSGTTLAVAAQLGRRWIGIDRSPEAIATTLRRFAKGTERMGDFVSQRRLVSPAEQVETLPLFNWTEAGESEIPGAEGAHIKDFILYAEQSCAADLTDILMRWTEWIRGTKGSMEVCRENNSSDGGPQADGLPETPNLPGTARRLGRVGDDGRGF
jgi:adenine-specific DNA-methyltransferase